MTTHTMTVTIDSGEMTYSHVTIRCEANGGPDCTGHTPAGDCEQLELDRVAHIHHRVELDGLLPEDAQQEWDEDAEHITSCDGWWSDGEHLHRKPVGSGCFWAELPGTYGEEMLDLATPLTFAVPVALWWEGEDEPAYVTPLAASAPLSVDDYTVQLLTPWQGNPVPSVAITQASFPAGSAKVNYQLPDSVLDSLVGVDDWEAEGFGPGQIIGRTAAGFRSLAEACEAAAVMLEEADRG